MKLLWTQNVPRDIELRREAEVFYLFCVGVLLKGKVGTGKVGTGTTCLRQNVTSPHFSAVFSGIFLLFLLVYGKIAISD